MGAANSPTAGDYDPGKAQIGVHAVRRAASEDESRRANRADWDRYADEYQATHGEFLGDIGFVWGPEGHTEEQLRVLGEFSGRDVLELGSGAGQCSRWVRSRGGRAIGLDLSHRQLQHSRRLDDATGVRVPSVESTATALPFADDSFDIVFCAFGALQFVADYQVALAQIARVLRPGGRLAFSVTHPMRWIFPDEAGPGGLQVVSSYWDRTPYVELDDKTNAVSYVEHHRTIGDWVRALYQAGLHIVDILEPEWPDSHERIWGGWSRFRGEYMPGTAIFVADQ